MTRSQSDPRDLYEKFIRHRLSLSRKFISFSIPILATSLVSAPVVPTRPTGDCPMMDVLMLALGLGFFALSIAYTYACDQL
jgi:hypothetical protein